jgi:hypothetical protein
VLTALAWGLGDGMSVGEAVSDGMSVGEGGSVGSRVGVAGIGVLEGRDVTPKAGAVRKVLGVGVGVCGGMRATAASVAVPAGKGVAGDDGTRVGVRAGRVGAVSL